MLADGEISSTDYVSKRIVKMEVSNTSNLSSTATYGYQTVTASCS